ncbi:MAG: tetratricopeptide repeat protein [Acaryochloridaceae cyanobacterium CSU_5_19]|nr:tetratricopeptide repeat protein [Acaryochloridaceae cyanobacterium CSU_5_19]
MGCYLCVLLLAPRVALAQPLEQLKQQAEAAQKQEQYPQAVTLWQRVVKEQPMSADAYYNLGLSLHHQLKLDQAVIAYQKATQLNDQYGAAYINLGLAWMQIGDYDQAQLAFAGAIAAPNQTADLADTHTLAHYNLAILFTRLGNRERALQETQAVLELAPKFTLAQELLKQLQDP